MDNVARVWTGRNRLKRFNQDSRYIILNKCNRFVVLLLFLDNYNRITCCVHYVSSNKFHNFMDYNFKYLPYLPVFGNRTDLSLFFGSPNNAHLRMGQIIRIDGHFVQGFVV